MFRHRTNYTKKTYQHPDADQRVCQQLRFQGDQDNARTVRQRSQ